MLSSLLPGTATPTTSPAIRWGGQASGPGLALVPAANGRGPIVGGTRIRKRRACGIKLNFAAESRGGRGRRMRVPRKSVRRHWRNRGDSNRRGGSGKKRRRNTFFEHLHKAAPGIRMCFPADPVTIALPAGGSLITNSS